MDPVILGSSFSLLFLAEMGDKSQLIAMTLACRFRPLPVIVGVFSAFLLLNLLAVAVGGALFEWVPPRLVLLAAGVLFLYFAFRSWRDAEKVEDDDAVDNGFGRGALLTSFLMILLAEFGDKTQLAMVGAPGSVLVGGTLALWAVSLVGILVGGSLLRRISPMWMHRSAALLFLTFGLFAMWDAVLAPESGLSALLAGGA